MDWKMNKPHVTNYSQRCVTSQKSEVFKTNFAFSVLLTVHLSIIVAINQLNAQNLLL